MKNIFKQFNPISIIVDIFMAVSIFAAVGVAFIIIIQTLNSAN